MDNDNTYQNSMYFPQSGHFGQNFNMGLEDEGLTDPNRPNKYQIQAIKNQNIQIVLSIALLFLLIYLNFFKDKKES